MIALGSDHAGLPLKKEIIALLEEMHLPYHDYGTYTGDSCDYAVFAQRAAKAVVSRRVRARYSVLRTGHPQFPSCQQGEGNPLLRLFGLLLRGDEPRPQRREHARPRRARGRHGAGTHDCKELPRGRV